MTHWYGIGISRVSSVTKASRVGRVGVMVRLITDGQRERQTYIYWKLVFINVNVNGSLEG